MWSANDVALSLQIRRQQQTGIIDDYASDGAPLDQVALTAIVCGHG